MSSISNNNISSFSFPYRLLSIYCLLTCTLPSSIPTLFCFILSYLDLLVLPFYSSVFLIMYSFCPCACLIFAFVLSLSSPNTFLPCCLSSISSIIRRRLGVCSLSKLIQMWDETPKLSLQCCSYFYFFARQLFEFPGIVHISKIVFIKSFCFEVIVALWPLLVTWLNTVVMKVSFVEKMCF